MFLEHRNEGARDSGEPYPQDLFGLLVAYSQAVFSSWIRFNGSVSRARAAPASRQRPMLESTAELMVLPARRSDVRASV